MGSQTQKKQPLKPTTRKSQKQTHEKSSQNHLARVESRTPKTQESKKRPLEQTR